MRLPVVAKRRARVSVREGLKRFAPDSRGSNAVEFALLMPVFCALVFGLLILGLQIGIAHSLAEISATAGRYAVVGLDPAERRDLAARWTSREAAAYPLIVADRLAASTEERDGAFVVTLTYDASYLPRVPFLGAVLDVPRRISRSSALFLP